MLFQNYRACSTAPPLHQDDIREDAEQAVGVHRHSLVDSRDDRTSRTLATSHAGFSGRLECDGDETKTEGPTMSARLSEHGTGRLHACDRAQ